MKTTLNATVERYLRQDVVPGDPQRIPRLSESGSNGAAAFRSRSSPVSVHLLARSPVSVHLFGQ